ncbi:MAG: type II toxin-antitoxin system RelE/ParE family toxin [Nitrospirae bacterium]|nr:type II toxin-antitoxin system RelE/ParE family toxin [Nitrospirota bacterium]
MARDLPRLPRNLQARIVRAIERRLMAAPTRYGSRLRRSLAGLWKLRVGDYRVVYAVEGSMVRVWLIAHRKEAYEEMDRRWSRRDIRES